MFYSLFKRIMRKASDKTALTEEEKQWNRMWEMWACGETESPYTELMNYHGEVNNGGHAQYFENIGNNGDLAEEMNILYSVLSDELCDNLRKAYAAHLALEQNPDDEKSEEVMENSDNVFAEREAEINGILENYCESLKGGGLL